MARKRGKKGAAVSEDEQAATSSAVPTGTPTASGSRAPVAEAVGAPPAPATATTAAPATSSAAVTKLQQEEEKLVQMVQEINLSGRFSTALARKPAPGTLANSRPVKLLTNMFRLSVRDGIAYHYDVMFQFEKKAAATKSKASSSGDATAAKVVYTDPVKIRYMVTNLFEQLKQEDKDFLRVRAFFDGKQNFYTINDMMPVSEKEISFEADIDGERRKVKAVYKFTGHSSDLSQGIGLSQDAMQALEIGLGYEVGKQMIQRGSRFFERSVRPFDVGLNLELRMGFVKSVKVTELGLCINLDRAAALFQKGGSMPDVMMNIVNFGVHAGRQYTKSGFILSRTLRDNLERELCNLRFEFRNPGLPYNRKYKLEKQSFTQNNVKEQRFDWIEKDAAGIVTREVKQISVFDYFQQKYKVTLKYPNLPCLAVGKDKKNMIPVELCNLVPEQYYDKKMTEKIQMQVTKATIQPPRDRFQQQQEAIRSMVPLAQRTISCGIEIKPVEVTGRIINPPNISFRKPNEQNIPINARGDGKYMNPCDFKWGTFNLSRSLDKWSLIQVQDRSRNPMQQVHPLIISFARKLSETGQKNGFSINPRFNTVCHNYQDYVTLKSLMMAQVREGMQLLLFIMPNDVIYNDIKKIANELGITTQCLKLNVDDNFMMDQRGKISKIGGGTFVNNMLMKMNAKFGGINAKLAPVSVPAFLKKKVMIVGMDVFHPGPGSPMKHSLAGMVASYTSCYTKYFQQAKAQPQDSTEFKRKEEITKAVYDAMVYFFERFKRLNNFFPEYVIVFRDGVSEGQFNKVRIIELDQIYRAMASLAFKAKVTFITVQKRHHFRMFEHDGRGHVDNPQPGTVIDKDVVHPDRFECYLNSHHALKGTSKPCHYCVVHNECGLSSDDMQQIAYYLCYLCARCYKPISIPIPVKYAHLVSEQASKSLESAMRNKLKGTVDEWIRVHENFSDKLNYA